MLPNTRIKGAVSIRQGKGWKGVFKLSNSNPMVFGEQLWETLQENWQVLNRFGTELLKYGFWEEYETGGLCPFCGKHKGYPMKISGTLIRDYQDKIFFPDPEMKNHSHSTQRKAFINSKDAKEDGLWLEWIYVIDPKTYSLEVLKSVRAKGFHYRKDLFNRKAKQDNYQYFPIGLFSLLGDEPNWEFMEKQGRGFSSFYYNKFPSRRKMEKINVL